jgi:RHS repeat-associated protein
MVDGSGALVWSMTSEAFGKATVASGSTIVNNLRFSSQYYDEETGLHYNYFRYYDAETGKYVSEDPIEEMGGYNLYSFLLNNPVVFVDLKGLAVLGPMPTPADILRAMNAIRKCAQGMQKADDEARRWWDHATDRYRCCINGQPVDLRDFPGITTGDAHSKYGVLHCALGSFAKKNGVGNECLNAANFLWEAFEFINPRYWEWLPRKNGPRGWLKDTIDDMRSVVDGYGNDNPEKCIPKECSLAN